MVPVPARTSVGCVARPAMGFCTGCSGAGGKAFSGVDAEASATAATWGASPGLAGEGRATDTAVPPLARSRFRASGMALRGEAAGESSATFFVDVHPARVRSESPTTARRSLARGMVEGTECNFCPVNSCRAHHAANHVRQHRTGASRGQAPNVSGRGQQQPGASFAKGAAAMDDRRDRSYQLPIFGADAQGSATGRFSPFCRISIEMPSGERTNAMRPSRGGRLMVMPLSCRCLQKS